MPKEKKVKKVKDPNAPKRGLSSYMFFSNERRPQLKADKPDLPFGEYAKIIGEEWRGMNEAAKTPYEAQAAKDKARYEKEMKAYAKKASKSPKKEKGTKEKKVKKGKDVKKSSKKAASKAKSKKASKTSKVKTPKKKTVKKVK